MSLQVYEMRAINSCIIPVPDRIQNTLLELYVVLRIYISTAINNTNQTEYTPKNTHHTADRHRPRYYIPGSKKARQTQKNRQTCKQLLIQQTDVGSETRSDQIYILSCLYVTHIHNTWWYHISHDMNGEFCE